MIQKIEIDNRKSSAVNGKWDPDKSKLIKEIQNASTPKKLMNEMFLSHPDDVDDMRVGNVKYPHHVISGGKCVLSIPGVKAAYSRLKQQNEYSGEMKKHIDRHRKELGMDVEEAELESLQNDLESTFESLQKAIRMAESKENQPTDNMFDLMLEKPTINPAPTGAPIAQDPAQNAAQAADLNAQPADPNVGSNPVNQPSQIPVANVDPTEDTSTNNPVEGPDDRDQNNLDGNARKEMYQSFANVMTQANKSCVFGTIFDQDIFKSEYKIVPYEMRYFYRLQNPVSVEVGELRFIPFGTELLEAQDKYDLGKKMFVFATNNDKPIFFNQLDKTIWFNDDKLNDTFDGFIEQLIQSNGELQISEDGQPQNQEADVQYQQNPADAAAPMDQTNPGNPGEQPVDQNDQGGMAPVDLDQVGGTPTATTGLGDQSQIVQPGAAPTAGEPAPVDLSAQNASYDPENDSILDLLMESGEKIEWHRSALDDIRKDREKARADMKKVTKEKQQKELATNIHTWGNASKEYARKMGFWDINIALQDQENVIKSGMSKDDCKKYIDAKKCLSALNTTRNYASEDGFKQLIMQYCMLYKFAHKVIDMKEPNADDIVNRLMHDVKESEASASSESIEYDDSIIDMMSEGTAFPNDALIDRNKKLAEEREKRKYGIPMFE